VGNLAVFSTWAVAKPNYFVPCFPGLAILAGMAWCRLCNAARSAPGHPASHLALSVLGLQWFILILLGLLIPVLGRWQLATGSETGLVIVGGLACCGALFAAMLWRRGKVTLALLAITTCFAVEVLIVYGHIAPGENPARGHARLAVQLGRLVPSEVKTLRFFHEIDEGLWFYLTGHRLAPLPGSQPRYSDSYDQIRNLLQPRLDLMPSQEWSALHMQPQNERLLRWLSHEGQRERFLLMRASLYDRLAPEMAPLAAPVYREEVLKRNELVLLQVRSDSDLMARSNGSALPVIGR
jgi:hypothetical protein